MASSILHNVFRATRPLRSHEAIAFVQQCRPSPTNLRGGVICLRATHGPKPIRTFHTTPATRATVATQNPRVDEDGNEMAIAISERAAKRLRQITSAPAQKNTLAPSSSSTSDSHLRVTVTSGGCHGFQYLMALEGGEKIDPDEDTVFAFEDGAGSGGTAKVVLDESSLELLKGSTVDFTTELIGSQFKIVGNPRATSSCGCGTSFDIE